MIESKENERVKHLNKLKLKKYRDEHGEFLVFGEHLIEEATKHGEVKGIYTTNNKKGGTLITKNIMKDLSEMKSIPERLALVSKIDNSHIKSDKILILEDLQNPQNVGGLIRSASAFGFKRIIMSDKCADIYNEKVIQASQGSIFHLNITRGNIYDEIMKLKQEDYHIVVTSLNASNTLTSSKKIALVLGNEGSGVTDDALVLADSFAKIETETVESLNVAIAGSILMYEWSLR